VRAGDIPTVKAERLGTGRVGREMAGKLGRRRRARMFGTGTVISAGRKRGRFASSLGSLTAAVGWMGVKLSNGEVGVEREVEEAVELEDEAEDVDVGRGGREGRRRRSSADGAEGLHSRTISPAAIDWSMPSAFPNVVVSTSTDSSGMEDSDSEVWWACS